MGYYMRYFVEDPNPPTMLDLAALFDRHGGSVLDKDVLRDGDFMIAQISIEIPDDDLFDGEIGEFREFVDDASGGWLAKRRVKKCLTKATAIVAAQVFWGGRELEEALSRLDPLWDWLMRSHPGLLQADGEGFYEGRKLVLAME